jgi:hypothetical protein
MYRAYFGRFYHINITMRDMYADTRMYKLSIETHILISSCIKVSRNTNIFMYAHTGMHRVMPWVIHIYSCPHAYNYQSIGPRHEQPFSEGKWAVVRALGQLSAKSNYGPGTIQTGTQGTYVCVCVNVYIYIYIYVYTYMYIVHVFVLCTCMCMCVYVCVCVYIDIIRMCVCVCV